MPDTFSLDMCFITPKAKANSINILQQTYLSKRTFNFELQRKGIIWNLKKIKQQNIPFTQKINAKNLFYSNNTPSPGSGTDIIFAKKFTLMDFEAKSFTP